jgi:hypothetical protein
MKDEGAEAHPSSFILHPSILISAIFLGTRLPLLLVRDTFFDELFTHWIAGKSFAGILAALQHDSGPPLYYFVVHLLGDPSVVATRVLSLVFAAVSIVLILRPGTGTPSMLAAILLAVFPPAILFAVDARAYALCAMFVTIGVLAIDRDRPVVAALALVAAAYSHYYGVLLFPILLLGSAAEPLRLRSGQAAAVQPASPFGFAQGRRRRYVRRRYLRSLSLALAVILYLPAFWLALHQPPEARAWMSLSWPDALFVRPPMALAIIGAVAIALSVRVNRYMVMVLVPVVLAIMLRVYVPMRFEAVLAVPLALWLAESLRHNRFRLALTTALIAIGVIWSALGIIDHLHRPPDPYRQAAIWIAGNIPVSQTVVASGYCYLETLMNGHLEVAAYPPEQGEHPGWRALPRPGVPAPPGAFYWIGERGAPELGILSRQHRVIKPIFLNDRAMVALVR